MPGNSRSTRRSTRNVSRSRRTTKRSNKKRFRKPTRRTTSSVNTRSRRSMGGGGSKEEELKIMVEKQKERGEYIKKMFAEHDQRVKYQELREKKLDEKWAKRLMADRLTQKIDRLDDENL